MPMIFNEPTNEDRAERAMNVVKAYATPTIDWTKPLRTTGGAPARLVCADIRRSDEFTQLVLINDLDEHEDPVLFNIDGLSSAGYRQLMNTPSAEDSRMTVTDEQIDAMLKTIIDLAQSLPSSNVTHRIMSHAALIGSTLNKRHSQPHMTYKDDA